jgi:hypothetical protein
MFGLEKPNSFPLEYTNRHTLGIWVLICKKSNLLDGLHVDFCQTLLQEHKRGKAVFPDSSKSDIDNFALRKAEYV